MPPPPPLPIRLCPKHGLVAGPDGRCMICHRGAAETDTASGARRLVLALCAVVTLVTVVVVWKVRTKPALIVDQAERPAPLAPPRVAPAPENQAPAPPSLDEAQAARHVADERQRQLAIEAEMHRVPIRMYMAKKCDICDAARDWLKEKGMTYSEVDVNDDSAGLEALRKLTPEPVLPTFDVEGEVLVSFAPTLVLGAARRAAEKRTRP
jgi:glutaredoxin